MVMVDTLQFWCRVVLYGIGMVGEFAKVANASLLSVLVAFPWMHEYTLQQRAMVCLYFADDT